MNSYKTIAATNNSSLDSQVIGYLNSGWSLYGDSKVIIFKDGSVGYYQTVVKLANNDPCFVD